MPKSYAEQIADVQVMLSGLRNNIEQLSQRGITTEFVDKLSANVSEAVTFNNEQEKLKADLKAKTSQLKTKLTEVSKTFSEAKKIVKLDIPKDRWKEFGISDKI
jgi:seryl-tRNA synthetase